MSRIAVVQMTSSRKVADNLNYLTMQVEILAQQRVKLILTPENVLIFGQQADYYQHAERLHDGPIQKQLAELARRHQVWLVIGSFPIQRESGVSTTMLVFDSSGQLIEDYDKLHMFDVDVADSHHRYRESDIFSSGSQVKVSQSCIGALGLTICYDLRFPALYNELANQGAQILLVPAAFTAVTGQAHWEVLLRARAIETQCWVVAANQTGTHEGGRKTWGHSMVINPWGEVVAQLRQESENLVAEIDLGLIEQVRSKMPIKEHARFGSHFIER